MTRRDPTKYGTTESVSQSSDEGDSPSPPSRPAHRDVGRGGGGGFARVVVRDLPVPSSADRQRPVEDSHAHELGAAHQRQGQRRRLLNGFALGGVPLAQLIEQLGAQHDDFPLAGRGARFRLYGTPWDDLQERAHLGEETIPDAGESGVVQPQQPTPRLVVLKS